VAFVADYEDKLRGLALGEMGFVDSTLHMGGCAPESSSLGPKTHALVKLGALVGTEGALSCYQDVVGSALAAGATPDEVVDVLVAVAPMVGLARVVAAAPSTAMALGYDIDAAFEERDERD
jgi:4-carboxymuconolactone decarboxylase